MAGFTQDRCRVTLPMLFCTVSECRLASGAKPPKRIALMAAWLTRRRTDGIALSPEGFAPNPMVAYPPADGLTAAGRPLDQRIGRGLSMGTQDVGQGLGELAGTPFDVTNAGLNLGLGAADALAGVFGGRVPYRLPTGASNMLGDAAVNGLDAIGVPKIAPSQRTPEERIAGDAIRLAHRPRWVAAFYP